MRIPQKLNNVGLKATGPRLVVLDVFQRHERRHLTADDIHQWTMKHGPAIGIGTIYRVLNHLTTVGILARTMFDSSAAVYELDQERQHDHLVCRQCGRVDEFRDDLIAERSRIIAKASGYVISRHQLALYGYCADCLATRHS